MEDLFKLVVDNGLGIASFLALIYYIYYFGACQEINKK